MDFRPTLQGWPVEDSRWRKSRAAVNAAREDTVTNYEVLSLLSTPDEVLGLTISFYTT